MGMFDTVIVLDDVKDLACTRGHAQRSFQSKDFESPSMHRYFLHGGVLYRGAATFMDMDDEATAWRVDGTSAFSERRLTLTRTIPPAAVRVYTHCSECEPVLVRSERASYSCIDIAQEHDVFVEFTLEFTEGKLARITRRGGSRPDLAKDLRARGLYVLDDDDPLAIAHRHVRERRDKTNRWD